MRLANVLVAMALGLAILSANPPAFCDSYQDGVAAYQAGRYERAAQWFQRAIQEGRKQPDTLFYLGLSYARLKQYDGAREAFEGVLHMLPPQHELAVKARNNITAITRQQIVQASNSDKANRIMNMSKSSSSGGQDNYLPYTLVSGRVIRFASERMPLRVYIADGLGVQGWNSSMKQVVLYAMRTWQSGSAGRVSFTQTYTLNNADIVVKWQKNFKDSLLGVSPWEVVNNTITRSDLNLAVYYPGSETPIPMEELKAIALHELGHAIGVRGHSPDPDDIMFFSRTPGRRNTLSRRDINTLGLLYRVEADVRNNPRLSSVQNREYYALFRQGLEAQNHNRATEAIAYYRRAMTINAESPEAPFNLGAVLINEGGRLAHLQKLTEAQRCFEEAVRLYTYLSRISPTPAGAQENLEIARNNLGLVNRAMGQQQ